MRLRHFQQNKYNRRTVSMRLDEIVFERMKKKSIRELSLFKYLNQDQYIAVLEQLLEYLIEQIQDEKIIQTIEPVTIHELNKRFSRMTHFNASKTNGDEGYVYVLKEMSKGYCKIGKTRNPKDRTKTFAVRLPFIVEYEALIPTRYMSYLERSLHTTFLSQRVHGEWFDLSESDLDYIKGLANE